MPGVGMCLRGGRGCGAMWQVVCVDHARLLLVVLFVLLSPRLVQCCSGTTTAKEQWSECGCRYCRDCFLSSNPPSASLAVSYDLRSPMNHQQRGSRVILAIQPDSICSMACSNLMCSLVSRAASACSQPAVCSVCGWPCQPRTTDHR